MDSNLQIIITAEETQRSLLLRIERNEWEDLHNNTAAIFFNYQAHMSDKLRTKHQTNLQRCLTRILRNRFLEETETSVREKVRFLISFRK